MFVCMHMLKCSQKMWNMSTWALHEIKRINPCNMHDEFHEYVEGGKKRLMETILKGLSDRFM